MSRTPVSRWCYGVARIVATGMLVSCADQATAPQASHSQAPASPALAVVPAQDGVEMTIEAVHNGRVVAASRTMSVGEYRQLGGAKSAANTMLLGATRTADDPARRKAGIIRSQIVLGKEGRKTHVKLARLEAGAPISRMETMTNGVVSSALETHWQKAGRQYVVDRVTIEEYAGDAVALRITYKSTKRAADDAGAWHRAPAPASFKSSIRTKRNGQPFGRPSFQDICDDPACRKLGKPPAGPRLKTVAPRPNSQPFAAAEFGGPSADSTDPLVEALVCSQPGCYGWLAAMITAGVAVAAFDAAEIAGLVATLASGGTLLPAETLLVAAAAAAASAYAAAGAAYWDCRSK